MNYSSTIDRGIQDFTARSVAITGSYTKIVAVGFQAPCILIIGKSKSNNKKT